MPTKSLVTPEGNLELMLEASVLTKNQIQIVVDRLTSENLENFNCGELMVTLTRASSSGQWKAAANIPEEFRFQDPTEKGSKVFKLWLRQNLSSKIRKCQGNCCRKIKSMKELFVFCTYGNPSWADKVTMKERVKYGH